MIEFKRRNRIVPLKLVAGTFLIWISISSFAQQQFTHTASKENISCNYDCTILDVAELNDNAAAIIFATSILEKGVNLNPHPIGIYYFKNKWHIFNLDGKTIPAGARFTVDYFMRPDDTHFQYSITRGNIQEDGSAFIDHPALNNNPTAKFLSFTSWNPASQGATTNREETNIQYNTNAGKWSISNINKKPLFARATYNISITSVGTVNTKPVTNNTVQIKELTTTPNTKSVSEAVASMYMTVWDNGVKLPGDNFYALHLDQTQVFSFEMGVSSPATLTSGQISTGKRIYEPITIKIHSGSPISISLLNAFIKNQNMAFTIEAFSNTAAGTQELNYTIKLTGVRIISFKQSYEEATLHLQSTGAGIKKYNDEIKIMFTKIEYLNSVGVTVADNL